MRWNNRLTLALALLSAGLSPLAFAQTAASPWGGSGTPWAQVPAASPLSVNDAFATDLTALSDGTLRLVVRPAPGYRVAPEHVSIRSQTDGLIIGPTSAIAAGHDQEVWLTFPLQRQPSSSGRLTVAATFQGCQGPGGVCYPPTTRTLSTLLPPSTVPAAQVVAGSQALEAALAQHQGQPVVVELYADWCSPCRKFEASLASTAVQRALQHVTWIRADLSADAPEDAAWMSAHGALGLPAVWVLRSGQQPSAHTVHLGPDTAQGLTQILQQTLR